MVGEEGPLEGRVDDLMHISNADYEKAVAAGRIFFFFSLTYGQQDVSFILQIFIRDIKI
jgi:hypothetical protein